MDIYSSKLQDLVTSLRFENSVHPSISTPCAPHLLPLPFRTASLLPTRRGQQGKILSDNILMSATTATVGNGQSAAGPETFRLVSSESITATTATSHVATAIACPIMPPAAEQQRSAAAPGAAPHARAPPALSNTLLQGGSNRPNSGSGSFNMLERGPGYAGAYGVGRLVGNGSFGLVCEARCLETGEHVAIKKVLQDPRYKNRELDVMKELCHPNIVTLRDYFYTEFPAPASSSSHNMTHSVAAPVNGAEAAVPQQVARAADAPGADGTTSGNRSTEVQRFLNVVMEHVPDTVYRVMKSYIRTEETLPCLLVRLYTYQMCRSLGYLHSMGICHRDIKPQNLLVDSRTHVLKLCDFGSAKRLSPSEPSVAYICSRFYRAPELMLGATEYTTAIDTWSIGCVLGELLIGKPLFAGETSVDQLVKIIQVLGTPTRKQMQAMNPNYTEFRFPDVQPKDWRKVIVAAASPVAEIPDEALQLLSAFLKYEPPERLKPYEALAHPFFDPLRDPACRTPTGGPLPPLFNFTEDELRAMTPRTRAIVVPEWLRQQILTPSHYSTLGNSQTLPSSASLTRGSSNNTSGGASATYSQQQLYQQQQQQQQRRAPQLGAAAPIMQHHAVAAGKGAAPGTVVNLPGLQQTPGVGGGNGGTNITRPAANALSVSANDAVYGNSDGVVNLGPAATALSPVYQGGIFQQIQHPLSTTRTAPTAGVAGKQQQSLKPTAARDIQDQQRYWK